MSEQPNATIKSKKWLYAEIFFFLGSLIADGFLIHKLLIYGEIIENNDQIKVTIRSMLINFAIVILWFSLYLYSKNRRLRQVN